MGIRIGRRNGGGGGGPTSGITRSQADGRYLRRTGGTLTGPLTLPGAPTADAHAATKAYVDDNVGGGGASVIGQGLVPVGSRYAVTPEDTSNAFQATGIILPDNPPDDAAFLFFFRVFEVPEIAQLSGATVKALVTATAGSDPSASGVGLFDPQNGATMWLGRVAATRELLVGVDVENAGDEFSAGDYIQVFQLSAAAQGEAAPELVHTFTWSTQAAVADVDARYASATYLRFEGWMGSGSGANVNRHHFSTSIRRADIPADFTNARNNIVIGFPRATSGQGIVGAEVSLNAGNSLSLDPISAQAAHGEVRVWTAETP